jgi:nucleoside-diphosphate-sugar epimerase
MSKIAVIGATGEVGFRLVGSLQSSHELVAIVRDKRKRNFNAFPGVEVRQVDDISDVASLASSLRDCTAIINTGYIWFAEDIHKAILGNSESIKHIVFTGSTGIYTSLPSQSASTKRVAEAFIQEHYRCPWTIIRPTMIYGHKDDRNISRLVRAIARFPVLPLIGNGSSLIQPVFIGDLLRAYEKALLNPTYFNKSYNIGGSKAYSNRDLISFAASGLGQRERFIPLPAEFVRLTVALLSAMRVSPISVEQVQRFQENKHIDISTFVADFDYVPCDFEHGIKLLIHEMKEHGLLR